MLTLWREKREVMKLAGWVQTWCEDLWVPETWSHITMFCSICHCGGLSANKHAVGKSTLKKKIFVSNSCFHLRLTSTNWKEEFNRRRFPCQWSRSCKNTPNYYIITMDQCVYQLEQTFSESSLWKAVLNSTPVCSSSSLEVYWGLLD